VRLVIADTGPINYLLQIGHIDTLAELFGRVILPAAVRDELGRSKAPLAVRSWIADPPAWVDVRRGGGTPCRFAAHDDLADAFDRVKRTMDRILAEQGGKE